MATELKNTLPNDPESDIAAWTAGSGMLLVQACALFPGLLPCLLLLLPFVLPLVVLGAAGALLVGLPLAIWRLVARAARPATAAAVTFARAHPSKG
jgi:hypothetical protein